MQKLSGSFLSGTKLKNKQLSEVEEIDSPVPMSIIDMFPQAPKTRRLEGGRQDATIAEVRKQAFLKSIIETD
jgi:transcriptional regulator of met regulon